MKIGRLQKMRSDVVVVRHGKQYLMSNAVDLTREAIRALYRIRQNVEEAFRSLKQELGWEGFRFRSLETLDAFFGLTLCGYAIIEVARSDLKLSFYKYRAGLIAGRFEVPDVVIDKCFVTA